MNGTLGQSSAKVFGPDESYRTKKGILISAIEKQNKDVHGNSAALHILSQFLQAVQRPRDASRKG